jgi:hypothetical protein
MPRSVPHSRLLRGAIPLAALLLAGMRGLAPAQPSSFIIVGAQVADGTGAPLVAASVRVRGEVIAEVGRLTPRPGELVVDGRGVAFVCLEHFTGVVNPDVQSLGLDAELLPLWIAHELAHVVRYTSPSSRSAMRPLVQQAGGYYSYWETGRHATLRELLVNEGLAVHLSRAVSPGHAAWEYFGYGRRHYARTRELEPVLRRAVAPDMDRAALGLRLRYLSGGMSDEARTVERQLLPERSGYYLGARLVEPAIAAHGLAWAIRASAEEIARVEQPLVAEHLKILA